MTHSCICAQPRSKTTEQHFPAHPVAPQCSSRRCARTPIAPSTPHRIALTPVRFLKPRLCCAHVSRAFLNADPPGGGVPAQQLKGQCRSSTGFLEAKGTPPGGQVPAHQLTRMQPPPFIQSWDAPPPIDFHEVTHARLGEGVLWRGDCKPWLQLFFLLSEAGPSPSLIKALSLSEISSCKSKGGKFTFCSILVH